MFAILLLGFKSSLYISDIRGVFWKYFLLSVVYLLLTVSSAEQGCLILGKSSLSVISFTNRDFGVVSKKSSPYPQSSRFSPMLCSRSFLVFTTLC